MDSSPAGTRTRKSPLQSTAVLLIAFLGLVAFILGLGDFRRQRYAVEQARWHAANYQRRTGEGGLLPLNLEPETPPGGANQMIALEWLDRQAATAARQRRGRVIVAQTVPITQVLRRDGRAVIFFQDGRFDAAWLSLAQFDALRNAPSREPAAPPG